MANSRRPPCSIHAAPRATGTPAFGCSSTWAQARRHRAGFSARAPFVHAAARAGAEREVGGHALQRRRACHRRAVVSSRITFLYSARKQRHLDEQLSRRAPEGRSTAHERVRRACDRASIVSMPGSGDDPRAVVGHAPVGAWAGWPATSDRHSSRRVRLARGCVRTPERADVRLPPTSWISSRHCLPLVSDTTNGGYMMTPSLTRSNAPAAAAISRTRARRIQ